MTATKHPSGVGVWRFKLKPRGEMTFEETVDAAGHTALDAFSRARWKLTAIRHPSGSVIDPKAPPPDSVTFSDIEEPIIVEDDCMTALIDRAAAEWNVDPKQVLIVGRRPSRQLSEARAACLLMAIKKWDLDTFALSLAVRWPLKTVTDYLRAANGKRAKVVRERVAKMGAAA